MFTASCQLPVRTDTFISIYLSNYHSISIYHFQRKVAAAFLPKTSVHCHCLDSYLCVAADSSWSLRSVLHLQLYTDTLQLIPASHDEAVSWSPDCSRWRRVKRRQPQTLAKKKKKILPCRTSSVTRSFAATSPPHFRLVSFLLFFFSGKTSCD